MRLRQLPKPYRATKATTFLSSPWRDIVGQWPADDRENWAERSAIMEHMGGLTRDQADEAAYHDIIRTNTAPANQEGALLQAQGRWHLR